MDKRYFLALANLALLISLSLFAWDKYLIIKEYFAELGIEFDMMRIFRATKHDIFVFSVGLFSLIGILFWPHKKIFFFISIFYTAIILVLLLLIKSFSLLHILVIFSEITFLWLLIWDNAFSVFKNKKGYKVLYLSIGALIYVCLFHIKW